MVPTCGLGPGLAFGPGRFFLPARGSVTELGTVGLSPAANSSTRGLTPGFCASFRRTRWHVSPTEVPTMTTRICRLVGGRAAAGGKGGRVASSASGSSTMGRWGSLPAGTTRARLD
jgi:hypothetical protein